MSDFFGLMFLVSCAGIVAGGIKLFKEKRNKAKKVTHKQAKTVLIVSVIISLISFIGIGTTPLEEANNKNEIVSENTTNNEKNTEQENSIDNNDTENNKQNQVQSNEETKKESLSNVPSYTNSPSTVINNNKPFF